MNSCNVSEADVPVFSIEELETRFEMETLAGPAGISPAPDCACYCMLQY